MFNIPYIIIDKTIIKNYKEIIALNKERLLLDKELIEIYKQNLINEIDKNNLSKRQQVALIMLTLKTFDMDINEAYRMADEFLSYNK